MANGGRWGGGVSKGRKTRREREKEKSCTMLPDGSVKGQWGVCVGTRKTGWGGGGKEEGGEGVGET